MSENIYNETLKDKFTLSPFEKYIKYGRFPYKFVIACFLVFLTTCQVLFISQHYSFNNPDQIQQFVQFFLNPDDPQDNQVTYLTLNDFQESFNQTLHFLTTLDINSIQSTQLLGNISIEVNYNYPYESYLENKKFRYPISNDVEQPLKEPFQIDDPKSIKQFWSEAFGLVLLIQKLQVVNGGKQTCWDIRIRYTFSDYGFIDADMQSTGGICDDEETEEEQKGLKDTIFGNNQTKFDYGFLQILVFLFAFLDLILGTKYIYEVIEMYTNNIYKQNKLRKVKVPQYKLYKNKNLTTLKIILNEQKPWDQLTLSEKLLFFDLFLPIRMFGNIFQLIGSSIIIAEAIIRINNLASYNQIFIGLGCFFSWFSMVKYLDYYEELHLISSVLESSIIPLCMAILNFLPVFLGYVFLGMCLFSNSSKFSSLQGAMASLLALIYGDSISDITRNCSRGISMEISMIYMCSYILLFIFAVNNIMVALIKEQLEIRKDLIATEKDLMNQLDINQSKFMGRTIQREESVVIKKSTESEDRPLLSMGSIAKLAILMNRQKEQVTQKEIEHNLQKVSKEETQKNYLYKYIIQNADEIKSILGSVERELWNDLDSMPLDLSEKKEIISYYCSQMIKLHQILRGIYIKTIRIEGEWQ